MVRPLCGGWKVSEDRLETGRRLAGRPGEGRGGTLVACRGAKKQGVGSVQWPVRASRLQLELGGIFLASFRTADRMLMFTVITTQGSTNCGPRPGLSGNCSRAALEPERSAPDSFRRSARESSVRRDRSGKVIKL